MKEVMQDLQQALLESIVRESVTREEKDEMRGKHEGAGRDGDKL